MKGSRVHNLYPNSNFISFNGYTLPFRNLTFPNIAHAHSPESEIFANLDSFGLLGAFKIKWVCFR